MSEFISILTHGRRLKAAIKELSVEELKEVQLKLGKIIDDRIQEEAELRQQEAERLEKIAALKAAIADAGLSPEDLMDTSFAGTSAQIKRPRSPKPAKYAYTDEHGARKTWTGQGRMPKAIVKALAEGASLEQFLLK
ncbi:H-NS family nucleoid-associated regulatory protein [Pseudidiomarina sp. PP-1MA]|uniref:DNA-binding protein n=1 Tax=Pseudidiomarina sp. PP-1MA TaxID=3237706 RepID=A0AB39X5J5_9GAMM